MNFLSGGFVCNRNGDRVLMNVDADSRQAAFHLRFQRLRDVREHGLVRRDAEARAGQFNIVELTGFRQMGKVAQPIVQGLALLLQIDFYIGIDCDRKRAFALQLCVLRYPGRVLAPGELIPAEVVEFIGAQLGLNADDLVDYAAREETRHEHLAELRALYGFRTFSGRGARELKDWLFREAELAASNEDIARRFVAECRRTSTVLPATSTIERLCATALACCACSIFGLRLLHIRFWKQ